MKTAPLTQSQYPLGINSFKTYCSYENNYYYENYPLINTNNSAVSDFEFIALKKSQVFTITSYSMVVPGT